MGAKRSFVSTESTGSLLGVSWVPQVFKPIDLSEAPADLKGYKEALNKGRSLLKQKKGDAIRFFRDALDLWPESVQARAELGWAFFKVKRFNEAEKELKQALKMSKRNSLTGMIYYNLGRVMEQQGKKKKALDLYKKSVKHRPNQGVQERIKALRKTP